ncbi:MAG: DJ-1/PfpI family protein [Thermoanaerobaculia bacterium]
MSRILIFTSLIFAALSAQAAKPYTRNVAIVVYENAEPLDWTGPFEVWNDAANFGAVGDVPAFNVYTVSKTTDPVDSQGLKVVPTYSIANAPKPDIIVIPGGNSSSLTNDPEFLAWAKKAATNAEIAESVCTGAIVLSKAGLLDGLEVTTWYGAIDHLQEITPKATVRHGRRFVDNGRVVTTAGISAGVDGSLHLVARLLGRRVADQVARYMEYHWTPESYLSTQYQYLNPSTDDRGRALQTAGMRAGEKDFAGAAQVLRELITQNGEDTDAWFGIGQILQETKDHAGAAEAFCRAATARGYYRAAQEYAAIDRGDDALASLQKAGNQRAAALNDPAFAKLRNDPRLKQVAAQ